jgi:hypothetical protein
MYVYVFCFLYFYSDRNIRILSRDFVCTVSYVQMNQVPKPLSGQNYLENWCQPWCPAALAPTMAFGMKTPKPSI